MRRSAVILLCLVAALSLAVPADAEVYKYVMEDGTILFTTERQPGLTPDAVYGGEDDGGGDNEDETSRGRTSRPIASPPDSANPNPTRDPSLFDPWIREASDTYGIPFAFIKAVIRVESAFDPHAVSHAGAIGLMQLMPSTAESLNCADPFDPRENILAGTQFLRILTNRYNGDINLVLAAYNAGSGAVSRFDGIPYEETRRYVERVYEYYQEYLDAESASAE